MVHSRGIKSKFMPILLFNFNANLITDFLRRRIFRRDEEAIVYSYWFNELCLGAVRTQKYFPAYQYVTRAHGYELFDFRSRIHYQPFKKEMDGLLDLLVFAASSSKKYYLEKYQKTNSDKYFVSRIGAPPQQYSYNNCSTDNHLVLLSCSNVVALKRIHLVIEALSLIDEIELEWIHVGTGAEFDTIQKMAYDCLDKKKNIRYCFKGMMQHQEYIDWLKEQHIDIFITATSSEGGCPVSISEALSFGIPVIGTATGGVQEMISNNNGILLEGNPSAVQIKEAIEKLADKNSEVKALLHYNAYNSWNEMLNSERNSSVLMGKLKQLVSGR